MVGKDELTKRVLLLGDDVDRLKFYEREIAVRNSHGKVVTLSRENQIPFKEDYNSAIVFVVEERFVY